MNTTKQLLNRDLQNCFSLAELENFKYILKHSVDELSTLEFVELLNDANYRTKLVLYSKKFTEKRYTAHEIWRFFQDATSFIVCDAILLHIEKNYCHYTSKYIDKRTLDTLFPLSNIDIFKRMAIKRKNTILTQFVAL